jgi:hypothetical protein
MIAATEGVQRIDDYAAALDAARATNGMLLVSVEPRSGDPTDLAGQHLDRPDVQDRFARSGTPWVFCRLGMDQAAGLVADPSLVEMRRGPGVFVVDHAHPRYAGRIVSILPLRHAPHRRVGHAAGGVAHAAVADPRRADPSREPTEHPGHV